MLSCDRSPLPTSQAKPPSQGGWGIPTPKSKEIPKILKKGVDKSIDTLYIDNSVMENENERQGVKTFPGADFPLWMNLENYIVWKI